MRGISSAGRAPALHAGGQEFESPILHHLKLKRTLTALQVGSFFVFGLNRDLLWQDVIYVYIWKTVLVGQMV